MIVEPISSNLMSQIKLDGVQPTPKSFEQWIVSEIENTNTSIIDAEINVQQYVVGETDNLHQVMISISKAQTALEMTAQVRNRLVEGFQEIMRMSI